MEEDPAAPAPAAVAPSGPLSLPQPSYEPLNDALEALLANQAKIAERAQLLDAQVSSASTAVAQHAASTGQLSGHPGLPQEHLVQLHERLTQVDRCQLPAMKTGLAEVPERVAKLEALAQQLQEKKQQAETARDEVRTKLEAQKEEVDKAEEKRLEVEAELQRLAGAPDAPPPPAPAAEPAEGEEPAQPLASLSALVQALDVLGLQLRSNDRLRARVADELSGKFSALWDETTHSLQSQGTRRNDLARTQLERSKQQADKEEQALLELGRSALHQAIIKRNRRLISSRCFRAWVDDTTKARCLRRGLLRLERYQQHHVGKVVRRWVHWCELEHGPLPEKRLKGPAGIPANALEGHLRDLTNKFARVDQELAELGWEPRMAQIETDSRALALVARADAEDAIQAWGAALTHGAAPLASGGQVEVSLEVRVNRAADACNRSRVVQAKGPAELHAAAEVLRRCAEAFRQIELLAPTSSVRSACEDCLLLWDAVKNLDRGDAAKAERDDLDEVAAEEQARTQSTEAEIQRFERLVLQRIEAAQAQLEKQHTEIAPTVDEHSRQFEELQRMLIKLSTFVEDMVAKITELSSQARKRLRPQTMRRTGGGYAAPPPLPRGRAEPLPTFQKAPSLEAGCDRWLNYARRMLET